MEAGNRLLARSLAGVHDDIRSALSLSVRGKLSRRDAVERLRQWRGAKSDPCALAVCVMDLETSRSTLGRFIYANSGRGVDPNGLACMGILLEPNLYANDTTSADGRRDRT